MSMTATALDPREVLEEGLSGYLGRPARVIALEVKPWAVSSHAIERWWVTLDSGERLGVVFKRLLLGEKLYGNEREVLIYRALLGGQRFGAPALYASVYDEGRGHYWLFLEYAGRQTLHHAEMDDWRAAVRWLAGLHAAYWGRAEELRALGCLGEHDAAFYRRVADAARRNLELAGATAALPLLDRSLRGFENVIAFLVRQPRTLVHGDLFESNLVIQPGPRVRPVDWESAAVGLGAWDLTRLIDGWGTDRPHFVALYLDELERLTGLPADRESFHQTLARCRVLNMLWHLRWSVEACREEAFVAKALAALEGIARRLEGECDG